MNKIKKYLITLTLALTAVFIVACGETETSDQVSSEPKAVVEQFIEENYTVEGSGIVDAQTAVLSENDKEAVVVSVSCQEVPGEKAPVSSGALVSVLENSGGEWMMVRGPDEISPEEKSLPEAISSPQTQQEINKLAESIKPDGCL